MTDSITESLGGSGGLFMIRRSPTEAPSTYAATRIDPGVWEQYQQHFFRVDQWGASLARQPAESVCTSDDLLARRRLLKSEWYNDFLKPAQIEDVIVLRTAPANTFTTLSVYRNRRAGDFGSEERQLLTRIAPHCRRAVKIQLQLNEATRAVQATEELLDRLSVGIALLDDQCRVRYMNDSARALVTMDDGLSVYRRELTATRVSDRSALRRILSAACGASHRELVDDCASEIYISRAGRKPPYVITAMPLVPSDRSPFSSSYSAMVVIRDPTRRNQAPVEVLQRVYRLTQAEATMLTAICRGADIRTYAETTEITLNTARWRLKQIYSKTDTGSQSELIRLVLRSTIPAP